MRATRLRARPPFLKVRKKPGPTCKPTAVTKRISPNSLMMWSMSWLQLMPKALRMMPTKSTQVIPSDMPLILNLPRNRPMKIETDNISTVVPTPPSVRSFVNHIKLSFKY